MGLCKCPKRKVTNLFCFEHRVNVCEHCLVSNHNKCIVQSYLQWLQDSDYNPNCSLCDTPLADQDTVRLVCYDVFHWACLNNLASRLPLHTAPAGYQCPSCQGPVFPPSNLASPIADVLKEQLSSVNWARAGLGLPLIEEPLVDLEETKAPDVTDYNDWSTFDAREQSEAYPSHSYNTSLSPPSNATNTISATVQEEVGAARKNGEPTTQEHVVVNFNTASINDTLTIHAASSPRKVYDTRDIGHSSVTQIDFDDDKYRRRPALSWFAQVLKNRTGGKRTSLTWKQRMFMFLLVGVLGFFTLIIIMAKLGRASAGSDPNLDPLLNPNIRVGKY
ncbi:zinc finger protein-like 1 [Boleophthalmus pectinirostris]|uniref:zinc finger protein-like 1 n=1 Tax=Boleophthalmus pectinirostris TaxID=150288 RepID=UPI00242FFCA5|nr:zinc finger protein-like 1 [Boleophthalmus pectinirostris]